MGLFSIRGENRDNIQAQVWYPNLADRSVWTRVMSQPSFKQRYDEIAGSSDSLVEVFELNKAIKGQEGVVPAGQPGIVAWLEDGKYEVHLPVKEHPLSVGAIATHEVTVEEPADQYPEELHAGRMAVAMAIQQQVNETK
jgi:hypothetical protein